jgi:hypothetical protein
MKGESLPLSSKRQVAISSDLAKIQVSSRIAVYRADDDQYYEAIVTRERNEKKSLYLEYANGDSDWLDLRQHMFILLEERTRRRGRHRSNDWTHRRDSDADTEETKVNVGNYKKRRHIESDEGLESDLDDEDNDYWKKDQVISASAEEAENAPQPSMMLDTSRYEIGTKVKKVRRVEA